MTREIKFRGWHKTEKYMTKTLDLQTIQFERGRYLPDYELMQFTGLLDKNGKEIYEGDICQEEDEEGVFEVMYHPLFYAFMAQGEGRRYLGDIANFTIDDSEVGGISSHSTTIEVIGNIYENPELLK